jgi:hypothetical protein
MIHLSSANDLFEQISQLRSWSSILLSGSETGLPPCQHSHRQGHVSLAFACSGLSPFEKVIGKERHTVLFLFFATHTCFAMDLSNMLVDGANGGHPAGPAAVMGAPQYIGRTSSAADSGIGSHNTSPHSIGGHEHRRLPSVSQLDLPASPGGPGLAQLHKKSLSPANSEEGPKEVTFVHITEDGLRGRIPFRVNITPSDSVDDIISTVKNFFGIYNNGSISFEDAQGKMFIPRYENFIIGGTAFVRGMSFPAPDPDSFTPRASNAGSPVKHPFQMPPPASNQPLKPAFGAMSPPPTFRRSNSASRSKGSTPTPFQGQGPSVKIEDGADDSDAASAKSSRRGVASADVSLDNIVEGSRRKRAKFDSSVSAREENLSATVTLTSPAH